MGGSQIVLSGSDFRNFSIINSTKKDTNWDFDITEVSISISLFTILIFLYKIQVTSIFPEDPDMIQVVKKFSEQIDKQLEKVQAHYNVKYDITDNGDGGNNNLSDDNNSNTDNTQQQRYYSI